MTDCASHLLQLLAEVRRTVAGFGDGRGILLLLGPSSSSAAALRIVGSVQ